MLARLIEYRIKKSTHKKITIHDEMRKVVEERPSSSTRRERATTNDNDIMTSEVAYRDKVHDGALSSDDDEEQEEEVSPLLLGQESDDDENDNGTIGTKKKNGRHEPPRPSMLNPRVSILSTTTNNARGGGGGGASRNRRRSSARFLDMRGGAGARRSSIGSLSSNCTNKSASTVISKKSLGDMYKRVIRMNAENRINASNSWNLKLIDNIDKFLLDEDATASDDSFTGSDNKQAGGKSTKNAAKSTTTTTTLPSHGRVNFTKASCTLDASVKIYSYRVDDVHLTSYKVLANLHRTDNNNHKNKKKGGGTNDDDLDNGDESVTGNHKKAKARSNNKPAGPTLESNLGNLNLSRLDSAFDIDPLFHKMSKTFDEGGAKGLLLANLGVGREGCDIVFDSTENLDDEKEEKKKDTSGGGGKNNGMVDITSLTAKLADSLADGGLSLFELALVPQLSGLRAEYSQLNEDGYVEADAPTSSSRSRRYAPEPEEEKEADRSIHQEAMERSRASFAHSFTPHDDDDDNVNDTGKTPQMQGGGGDDDEYAADDYGGGYNDDDDDDDDNAFVNFLATENNASRFSSASFTGSVSQQQFESQEASQQTSVLLDAIAAGQLDIGQSDYDYFDASQVNDNAWAGATHWKRASTAAYSTTTKTPTKLRRASSRTTKPTPKKSAKKKKTAASKTGGDCVFVNLMQHVPAADLDDILRKTPALKGGRQRVDPLQLTTVAKLTKTDNLLPPDIGIGIEVLSSLFLRPDAALFKQQILQQQQKVASVANTAASTAPVKAVGFNMDQVQTFGDSWDNGGHGDNYDDDHDNDDGGAGYDMGGGNDNDDEGGDFFVQELDNVRKVEKVSVGYATVAKKVDVKRLKRDLWVEIESHFDNDNNGSDVDDDADAKDDDSNGGGGGTVPAPHSFQQAVKEMEANKTQMDVTLPYYFICILHLANEQNLRLESKGLDDFEIHLDNDQ